MTEQQVPTWKDYLGQLPTHQPSAPYPAGTKTMRHQEMQSANARHAASLAAEQAMHAQGIAVDRERLALQKWVAQMEWNLAYMEFDAAKAATRVGAAGTETLDTLMQGLNIKSGYINGQTPGQYVSSFTPKDVLSLQTTQERLYDRLGGPTR